MPPRHFLDVDQLDSASLRRLLDMAHAMKRGGRRGPAMVRPKALEGATLLMIFEKPSMRTRVSFDLGMRQLGGEALFLSGQEIMVGKRESIEDTARVLSRYGDIILLRTVDHGTLLELARHASVPVINGLTNHSHPCQIIADLQTVEEAVGPIETAKVAWVGDCNNVATSWIHAAVRLGFELRIASPPSLQPHPDLAAWMTREGGRVTVSADPVAAVEGATCVIADTWVSIGDTDVERRMELLGPYRVDEALMARAAGNAVFLHCLPAYRGNEVTAGVIDGPQSVVFDEAENRLHAQKAILAWCLGVESV
ncbi:MAG: ornithine carbamoyltransferase [Hyphomicrobiaceae bacterium]